LSVKIIGIAWIAIVIISLTIIYFNGIKSTTFQIYSYLGNRQQDLQMNLVSEAIGIVITVFVIDRIIKWRDERRLRSLRILLLDKHIGSQCDKIIEAYEHWLTAIDRSSKRRSKTSSSSLIKKLSPARTDDYSFIRRNLGEPLGSNLVSFVESCSRFEIELLDSDLHVFFIENEIFLPPHRSWSNLHDELAVPLNKINNLVDRYPNLVDWNLAYFSLTTEDIDTLKNNSNPSTLEERNALMERVLNIMMQSIRLKYFLREGKFPKKSNVDHVLGDLELDRHDILVSLVSFAVFPLFLVAEIIIYFGEGRKG
jgi:hypothetical protein